MKKTFLEWSVADKKAVRDKVIKECMNQKVQWFPKDFTLKNYLRIGNNFI